MEKTDFAGLTRLDRGEPLSSDNFSFQNENPEVIDRLLRVGASTHKHDGHPALADPTKDVVVAAGAAGGSLPSDIEIYVVYTLLDAYGGETAPVAPQVVSTQPGLATPDNAPDLELDHDAGSLLAGNYYYAVTVTDGKGGETMMGPQAVIVIEPGYANSQVTISGLQSLVEEAGGTQWRLWRMIDGGSLRMLGQGNGDSIVDDGSLCPNCSVTPPTSTSRTNSTNTLRVTVPGGQPAAAVSFRIYASVDGSFDSPALLGEYPVADAGTLKEFTELALQDGSPPDVSRTVPGANKIDPDTDLLNFPWKRPVPDAAALPQAGNALGDIRETLDDNTLHGWTGSAWVTVGGSGGGGGGGGGGQYAGRLDMPAGDVVIPDNGVDRVDVTFTVPETADVGDVKVGLYIEHPYRGDLQISLISPTGTEIVLATGNGQAGMYYGTNTDDADMVWLTDTGGARIDTARSNFITGDWKPENPLKGFRGLAAGGTWKLRIFDQWTRDQGTLRAASLVFSKYTAVEGHSIQDENGPLLPQRPTLRIVGPGIKAEDDEANGRTNLTLDLKSFIYGRDEIWWKDIEETVFPSARIFTRDAWGDAYSKTPFNGAFNYGADAAFPSSSYYQDLYTVESASGALEVISPSGVGFLRVKSAGQINFRANMKEGTYQQQRYVKGDWYVAMLLTQVDLANMSTIRLWANIQSYYGYGYFLDINPNGPSGAALRVGYVGWGGMTYGPSSATPRGSQDFAPGEGHDNWVVLRRKGKVLTAELWVDDYNWGNPNNPTPPAAKVSVNLPTNAQFDESYLLYPRVEWNASAPNAEQVGNIVSAQAEGLKALWVSVGDSFTNKTAEKMLLRVDGKSDFMP